MKITLLCENVCGHSGSKVCLAEWWLSAFIQVNNTNILFDTGHTDIYKKNAENLGINLDTTDVVVLSHYHWDHTGGLRYHDFKEKKKLIAHPDVFLKMPKDQVDKISSDFDVQPSESVVEISEDIYFLGQVPRTTTFESGKSRDEHMFDDTAIIIKSSKWVIVIAWCSHSWICNICEYAKEISGQDLYAVIGGFHLFEDNKIWVEKTIEYFKKENPELILPMHCVDMPTQAKFHINFNSKKYSTGDVIELDI